MSNIMAKIPTWVGTRWRLAVSPFHQGQHLISPSLSSIVSGSAVFSFPLLSLPKCSGLWQFTDVLAQFFITGKCNSIFSPSFTSSSFLFSISKLIYMKTKGGMSVFIQKFTCTQVHFPGYDPSSNTSLFHWASFSSCFKCGCRVLLDCFPPKEIIHDFPLKVRATLVNFHRYFGKPYVSWLLIYGYSQLSYLKITHWQLGEGMDWQLPQGIQCLLIPAIFL